MSGVFSSCDAIERNSSRAATERASSAFAPTRSPAVRVIARASTPSSSRRSPPGTGIGSGVVAMRRAASVIARTGRTR